DTRSVEEHREKHRREQRIARGKERKGKERKGKGTERNGMERNGTERNGTERNGTERNGTERNGTERNGTERKGTEGKGREGKGREGKGREGKGREGKEREEGGILAKQTTHGGYANAYRTAALRPTTILQGRTAMQWCSTWRARNTLSIKGVSLTACRIEETENTPRRSRPSSGQTGQRRASIAFRSPSLPHPLTAFLLAPDANAKRRVRRLPSLILRVLSRCYVI
ncbi:hypothetical protein ALC57_17598, partial [Trachymyrmex cornetzi]